MIHAKKLESIRDLNLKSDYSAEIILFFYLYKSLKKKSVYVFRFFIPFFVFIAILLSFIIFPVFIVLMVFQYVIRKHNKSIKKDDSDEENRIFHSENVYFIFDESHYLTIKDTLPKKIDKIDLRLYKTSKIHDARSPVEYFKIVDYIKVFSSYNLSAVIDSFSFGHDLFRLSRLSQDYDIFSFYFVRIPHKVYLSVVQKRVLQRRKHTKVLYSSGKEDRYAMSERRISTDLHLSTKVLPHGLEYGIRFPRLLNGDKFYCLSPNAKDYLKKLYADTNIDFVYSKTIAHKLLTAKYKDTYKLPNGSIVFYPETRDFDSNLKIIELLESFEVDYFVKLHPRDIAEKYNKHITFGQILRRAIYPSNIIAIARKSTVLLEVIELGGTAIALPVTNFDRFSLFHLFPSLSDSRILTSSVTNFKIDLKSVGMY